MKLSNSSALVAAGLALCTSMVAFDARAATVVVNSLLDTATAGDHVCTLREAIKNVNATTDTTGGDCVRGDNNTGVDAIIFTVAGTITVTSALPDVTSKVTINGKGTLANPNPSCPAWPHAPSVALAGSTTNKVATGLVMKGGNSTVRSLAVQSFTRGIKLITLGQNRVQCSYLGTNLAGTAALGNGLGVDIGAASNGNFIGTDSDGIADANEGNLVSGNTSVGLGISGATTNNRIAGNRIGTNAAGTAMLSNGLDGVGLTFGTSANIVGTNGDGIADVAERNVISGNLRFGVDIYTSSSNRVAGNYIGTNLAGTAAIPNGDGVRLEGGAKSNVVGTNGDGTGDAFEINIISGNTRDGVILLTSGTDANVVMGNRIGVSVAGTALGNGENGVEIYDGPANCIIGSNRDGKSDDIEGNRIAYNGEMGIAVMDTFAKTTYGNALRGNSIEANGDLGIDLQPYWSGISYDDPGDADDGPNGLQNYPKLTSATLAGTTVTVVGTLNSKASSKFYIDYYLAPTCTGFEGATGYGAQGSKLLLTQTTQPTNPSGDVNLSATLTGVTIGQFIVATATTTASGAGNTSEFSKCIQVK